jgi:2-iminobutanoate/2-iminopropanoate deaminase
MLATASGVRSAGAELEANAMTIQFFEESNVATQALPRSVATRAGDLVFVSGQVARDDSGVIVEGGIEAHTRQAMKNVADALALAGCTLADVAKVTIWLDDARDFGDFNRVYAEFFPGPRPARSTIQASNMVGTRIEIEVIAFKPEESVAGVRLSRS